jgi:hypothetical protein
MSTGVAAVWILLAGFVPALQREEPVILTGPEEITKLHFFAAFAQERWCCCQHMLQDFVCKLWKKV